MDAEWTSVEGARRWLAVGDVEHRDTSPVPDTGTRVVSDMSSSTDHVERLPERGRGRSSRHDRSPGERRVVPGVELKRVAASGGKDLDRLVQRLAIKVDGDKRR